MDLVLTRGREGVQNPKNLADVICERPLMGVATGMETPIVLSDVKAELPNALSGEVN